MEAYSIIVFFIYFGLLVYIIPSSGYLFDLYERKFRLLPSWFKIIAFSWLIISVVLILIFKESITKWENFLILNINICLFISFFSKQKYEDEFSEQVRFKAFTYSFVAFVAMFGAFGAQNTANEDSLWNNFVLHGAVGGGLLVATLYFYFTIYKLRKNN